MCNEPERLLPQVNQKVEVLWPKDEKYYPGTIVSIDEATQKRHILYDYGDKEFLDFNVEKWRLILKRPSMVHSINFTFHQLRKAI